MGGTMTDLEFGAPLWIICGVLGYLIFSICMATRHKQHMKDHQVIGGLLFIAALILGPISFALFFIYGLVVGGMAELNMRMNLTAEHQQRYHHHA
jgi:hypothetical protein